MDVVSHVLFLFMYSKYIGRLESTLSLFERPVSVPNRQYNITNNKLQFQIFRQEKKIKNIYYYIW